MSLGVNGLKNYICFITALYLLYGILPLPICAQEITDEFKPDEVIVTFRPNHSKKVLSSMLKASGITIKRRFPTLSKLLGREIVVLKSNRFLATELKRLLLSNPWVENVSLNHKIYPLEVIPNDPYFPRQWAHQNSGQEIFGRTGVADADIDSTQAWTLATNGSDEVLVAVIDTGIDYTHEDLVDKIWVNQAEYRGIPGFDDDDNGYVDDIYGVDIGDNDSDPMDSESHGTHVAGIIGASWSNGIGVAGVAPDVKLVAVKGFNSDDGTMYTSDEVAAIDYVLHLKERGEDIVAINASYGCHDCYETIERDAIERVCSAGILFVVAAGNEAANNDIDPSYPASYDLDCIISVAATDNRDNLVSYSDYGATSVDLGAPGWGIYSTDAYTGGYAYMNGTSMATAFISGAIAFLKALYPDEPADALKRRILKGTESIPSLQGKTLTGGRLNLFNAATLPGICKADIDQNGQIDEVDLSDIANQFGLSLLGGNSNADLDRDGDIDGLDLSIMVKEWGRTDCL